MSKISADDVVEIHQVLGLFTHVMDNMELDALHLVVTEDVVIDPVGEGESDPEPIRGRETFRGLVALRTGAAADHHTLDPVVLVDEDGTVRARSRFLAVGPDGSVSNGEYRDVLRRTPEGWRISYRRAFHRKPLVVAPSAGLPSGAWGARSGNVPTLS
ncbi:nuclear transport factor 2 family protein [Streptomyces sp. AK02-01A]|uniref:nuclear transport factor 2 family protein n=1 Tax=Streptomyces sp. AK02-01A TaxID=3028648 RepID=UPI0029B0C45D|nr:nuclear transport factor 2 family protein [Streptomyces sp. AK02-01A]MDX3854934.1 nuclear transport factor 2 family protein [Streptomyces sp. AK02-01A]